MRWGMDSISVLPSFNRDDDDDDDGGDNDDDDDYMFVADLRFVVQCFALQAEH